MLPAVGKFLVVALAALSDSASGLARKPLEVVDAPKFLESSSSKQTTLPKMYLRRPHVPGPIPDSPAWGLTIVVMGYTDKLGMTRSACHHASMAPLVREVLLVWNSEEEEWNEPVNCTMGGNAAKVKVLPQRYNTLLNRYAVWPNIHTDCALLLDDDVMIKDSKHLHEMYHTWRKHPRQIVGLSGRCPYEEAGRFVYDFRDCQSNISITSGQGNMLHRNYMKLFMAKQPRAMLEHMFEMRPTCEDIALHFLVSNVTGLPPLQAFDAWDQSTIMRTEMHLRRTMTDWLHLRSVCMEKFTQSYGRFPLVGAVPP